MRGKADDLMGMRGWKLHMIAQRVSMDRLHARRWFEFGSILDALLPTGPKARAMGLAVGAVLVWATWPSLATIAQPAPPFLILSLAALAGFLASASQAVARRRFRNWIAIPPRTALLVTAGLLGNNAFYLAAINRIGPAEANIVHYLWPVFMVGLSAVLLRRTPSLLQGVGVLAGFSGVALALSPQLAGGGFHLVGFGLGLCGAFTFALYSVARSVATVEGDFIGPSMGLIAISAWLVHAIFEPQHLPSVAQLAAIVAIGVGPFTLSNMFWDKATRSGAPAVIGSMAFMTPLVAIALLSALGISQLTGWLVGGALLAVTGAVLTAQKSN